MRKRQLKKFVKAAKATGCIDAYREAHRGGSKRLLRRRKCMTRHSSGSTPPIVREIRAACDGLKRQLRLLRQRLDTDRCVIDRLAELA